ncbi:winged helix-turn-helix transcriptional regulator [Neptunicella marina]|uniref:Winged helix-turn-helix domain-containing protein n=1 Tax=Neptunicella marina TaxID=2125989 RepID=A0A8J6ITE8_9ALTE|nr:winged helix-turn-helix transcriptional regulator [Neptunicella marina]MBC3765480.1 winged helix-turn-helix domain-containing protein [Neptunicella marina]
MACYKIGDFLLLDSTRRKLFRQNTELELPELSFRFLVCLAENAPNVVAHNVLLEQVWQGKVVSEDTIKKRVSRLRDVIQGADNQALIIAERGLGYRLNSSVVETTTPIVPLKNITGFNSRIAYAILALSICSLLAWLVFKQDKPDIQQANKHYSAHHQTPEQIADAVSQYLDVTDQSQLVNASDELNKLLALYPTNIALLCVLSQTYQTQYQLFNADRFKLEQAVNLAKKAIKEKPAEAWGYLTLANAQILSGQAKVAVDNAQRSIELAPDWVNGYVSQARAYRLLGQTEKAWQSISYVYDMQPDNFSLKLERARVLTAKNMFSWAAQSLQELNDEQADQPYVQLARAELLVATKDYANTRPILDKLNADYPHAFQVSFLNALLFDIQGQQQQAISHFADLTKAPNPYSTMAKLFLILNGAEYELPDVQNTGEWSINHVEQALFQLASGDNQGFLSQLQSAIQHGFSTEYLLQAKSIQHMLEGASSSNIQQRFQQIQLELHNINQRKRVKRLPLLTR